MKDVLEYKGYIGKVSFDADDKVLYGKIIGIDDLILFEGNSVEELVNAFEESVDDYLETCKELGKEPDKVYKGVFNVRLSSDTHKKIALIAAKKGWKMNAVVKKAFSYLIDNEDKVLQS